MSETKDWRKICAACHEGEPPEDCEYYGEPCGCNSPTYGEYPTCKESLQVGNAAKIREALSDACYAMFNFLKTQNGGYEEMAEALDKAKAALAAPPRNCDVGSLDEQITRFNAFCESRMCSDFLSRCPLADSRNCRLAWAQMPYEKGENNEK